VGTPFTADYRAVPVLRTVSCNAMSVDTADFRTTIGQFATGVTVVTAFDGDQPQGITVNALSSVSLDPPMVMIALDRRRFIVPAIEATGRYAVNILTEHQQELSDCFAGAAVTPDRDAFCGTSWHRGQTEVPVLDGVIASLECVVAERFEVGDHVLYVGRVEATSVPDGDAPPLLYHRRRYLRIERATSSRLVGKPESPQG
jgi:flavin reductase (DIM6/NTAB) family NADH-FMN oxidoreductase RutF